MTDAPILNRPPRPRSPLAAGDFAVLAIVIAVFLVVVVLGCAVLWDALNPSDWTADGWAAAGGWFAGFATVSAVIVALQQSRQARTEAQRVRDDLERQHKEQLREEALRSDLAVTVAEIRVLDEFVTTMRGADDAFRRSTMEAAIRGANGDEQPATAEELLERFQAYAHYTDSANRLKVSLEVASLSVRDPQLRTALDQSVSLVELLGRQIHTWSMHVAAGRTELPDELEGISALPLKPELRKVGTLFAVAHHAMSTVKGALDGIPKLELWPAQPDQGDASIAP